MQGPGNTKRMAGAPGVVQPRPPPNVKPGAMIGDKYRIECELGRGGFGVVVRAMHLTLDQRVAIKVLTEGEGSTAAEWAEDAARFRQEAKATAALRSEHVVRVLDVDVLEHGYPYIVMEYLEGKTLHEAIYTTPSGFVVEDAVDVAIQILAALAEAHAAGIVHRDLKPANVHLSRGVGGAQLAKVLDFGVSKMLAGSSQQLTRTGAVVGTVAYMAPEQMLDAKSVDGRADLWSAGLVLYESLARMHPFGAASAGAKVVTAILREPLAPIRGARPDVPPGLEAIIARLLEKSPTRRFQSALEAAGELAAFAPLRSRTVLDAIRRTGPSTGAAAPRVSSAERARSASSTSKPRPKRSSAILGFAIAFIAAGVVLSLVAGGVFYVNPSVLVPRVRQPRPSATLTDAAVATPGSAAPPGYPLSPTPSTP